MLAGSSTGPCWFHLRIHSCFTWGMFVSFGCFWWVLCRKRSRRAEDRGSHIASLHFKRCWVQTGATKLPNINYKSMNRRCKNPWELRLGFGIALGACWVDFGMLLGPCTLDFGCFLWARCYFLKKSIFSSLSWLVCEFVSLECCGIVLDAFWELKVDLHGFNI